MTFNYSPQFCFTPHVSSSDLLSSNQFKTAMRSYTTWIFNLPPKLLKKFESNFDLSGGPTVEEWNGQFVYNCLSLCAGGTIFLLKLLKYSGLLFIIR